MPEHQQIQQSKKPDTIFQKQATPVIQTPTSNPVAIIQRARINPKSLTPADVMQLQRTIGNRAVAQLLSGIVNSSTAHEAPIQRSEIPEEEEKPMQGKFETVQLSETPEEEEPLQGKMVGTAQRQEIPEEEPPMQGKFKSIQRQKIPEDEEPLQGKFEDKPEIACPSCFASPIVQRQELEDEEKTLQGKMIETIQRQEIPEEESLQGKMAETVQRQEIPEEEPLQTKKENNTGMPDNLKAGVENLSAIDMSDVRVHYNSSKPADVGALAYTQGANIHVAPGQERHLPHEAWHVVQQKQGRVRPTMQMKGTLVNDDLEFESEADVMGREAIQSKKDYPKCLHSPGIYAQSMETIQFTRDITIRGEQHVVCSPSEILNDLVDPFRNWKNGNQNTSGHSSADARKILASEFVVLARIWCHRNDKTAMGTIIKFTADDSLSGGRGVKHLKADVRENGSYYSFVWHVRYIPD